MTTKIFNHISAFQPRQFLSPDADLSCSIVVEQYGRLLIYRRVDSSSEFEQWILDCSEYAAGLDQTESLLNIAMTCQTDDPAKAAAYTKFIETVAPVHDKINDQLDQRFLELWQKFPLEEQRYAVYLRGTREDRALFRDKNIPLFTKIDLLTQEYQTISAAMTVPFEGREQTLPEVSKYLLEPDRLLREKAWRALTERRLAERRRLDDLFDRMLALRQTAAANAGCRDFIEYQFRHYHRFDYSPADCAQFHAAVANVILPLWKEILQRRKLQMGLAQLRPWDLSADPLGRPALKPFTSSEELILGCEKIFQKIDPLFGRQFSAMAEKGLLDLLSRKGKAPGGYQSTLQEARQPFIFMNSVGVDTDVRTLLHEGGHAFHALACVAEPLVSYRRAPMEFSEVASMAMELLGGEFLGVFYSSDEKRRSVTDHLEDVVYTLVWVAVIDAFQHWIYSHPGHSHAERDQIWVEIYDRFGGELVDWTGLKPAKSALWHKQLHIFEVPFYYIEYGIAQLGALQVWENYQKDHRRAVADYQRALRLGGAKPLPELFKTAGLEFDFSQKRMEEWIGPARAALEL
ncbi:MAG: M3 family oligoendopeptidase [Candidatus Omnitrophica bacterium]|nr:M3 family oligoendopeptidase [Candidatus Omnitrophota bacterium]